MSKAIDQTLRARTVSDPRQRLMDAALELIPEVGWAGVSTRKVAERAGLGSGLVHYHFTSLQELLTVAAIGAAEKLLRDFAAQLRLSTNVGQAVAGLAGTLDSFDTTGRANLLMTETLLASTRHQDVRVSLEKILADFRKELAEWLRSSGGGEDAEGTAVVLSAVFDGLMLHRTIDPSITSTAVLPVLLRLVGNDRP